MGKYDLNQFLAFDIGASSGRAIVGTLDNGILVIDEIYRFPNGGIKKKDSLIWDLSKIYAELLSGLREYVRRYGNSIDGIGIDSWGVDFVLLDKNNELVGPSFHYRDSRTKGVYKEIFKKITKENIFSETGTQFLDLNTMVQLYSLVLNNSPQLSIIKTFLMIPDYFNFLLSGKKVTEYSIATTSQLFNPSKNEWAFSVIEKLDFKRS